MLSSWKIMGMSDYEMMCELEKDKAEFDERMAFVKNDQGKLRYSLIPSRAEEQMVRVLTFGAQKYSADNWRKCEDLSRYIDAALRHIASYRVGQRDDGETGLHHLAHAMCCLSFIVDIELGEQNDKINND